MKKGVLLNSQISAVVADMGHWDTLGIGDLGMPVPKGTKKIDLSVKMGTPDLITVLRTTLTELEIQRVFLASEMKTENPKQLASIKKTVGDVPIVFIPQMELQDKVANTKAFVRTGEASHYSNVILESGVTF
ncbi:D-ribose pyranase [Lacticaseibacillus paracasei]|jgi:D-ribose pyranase|uniref:D-ribose pyranase n=1 Tax=Lacticaseibacillus paracasei TaxID=1597 RepID=UPI000FED44A1|nr:D-ribose pyranase [Lacticaseibacillus paracasei]QPC26325.1 D-ribose pyranase [Lacticaseibacillus paracasei subsp. tolerans]QPC29259.1 D-ribose pyranase [Lacticaseibacillus paracasei subsp. tolerans]RNE41886.1 D-ribose pyranase [Lacticaseibacillus paracasei]